MPAKRSIPTSAANTHTHQGIPASPGSEGITVVVTLWLWNMILCQSQFVLKVYWLEMPKTHLPQQMEASSPVSPTLKKFSPSQHNSEEQQYIVFSYNE